MSVSIEVEQLWSSRRRPSPPRDNASLRNKRSRGRPLFDRSIKLGDRSVNPQELRDRARITPAESAFGGDGLPTGLELTRPHPSYPILRDRPTQSQRENTSCAAAIASWDWSAWLPFRSRGRQAPQMPEASFPSRAIKIISASPAGGGVDLSARIIADQLQKLVGSAGDGGESDRWQQQHRGRSGREGGTRRLHASRHAARHHHRQRGAVQATQL